MASTITGRRRTVPDCGAGGPVDGEDKERIEEEASAELCDCDAIRAPHTHPRWLLPDHHAAVLADDEVGS